jgi:hypothetical protein
VTQPTDLAPPTTPAAVYVDRDGDEWRVTGRDADGDVLVACDQPRNPEDRGDWTSFPWTLRAVEQWFGPLVPRAALGMVRAEDVEESVLAEVDAEFQAMYGPNWRRWERWQVAQYLDAVGKAHAEFAPDRGAVA